MFLTKKNNICCLVVNILAKRQNKSGILHFCNIRYTFFSLRISLCKDLQVSEARPCIVPQ